MAEENDIATENYQEAGIIEYAHSIFVSFFFARYRKFVFAAFG